MLPVQLVKSSSQDTLLHKDKRDGGYELASQFEGAFIQVTC